MRDLRVSNCTGDGVCIGGASNDVVISNIVSTNNRRQGLSITNCTGIKVYDSEFSYTNGTSPECGIDIEPDLGYSCSDVWIENCSLVGNAKYGLNVYKRASDVTLVRSRVQDNGSCGVVTVGCGPVRITQNAIHDNSATGLLVQDGTAHCLTDGNLFYANYSRLGAVTRSPFTQTGWTASIERDILMRGSLSDVVIGSNDYR
ncbi:MAG: right-handed parallel beta-helix repeat-containing protein [Lysobacter sp.]|nr:right-handed parallel beta-helix repeat-containing protein [Lysobacter sp.]